MTDREQARAELAELIAEELGHCIDLGFVEEPLHVMLDHPDLVLRALGMERVGDHGVFPEFLHRRVWVEPPPEPEKTT